MDTSRTIGLARGAREDVMIKVHEPGPHGKGAPPAFLHRRERDLANRLAGAVMT
jgi:hypothetical protein